MAGTATAEETLRTYYGEAAAKATLARNILAPVAGRLGGHPSELHRRCMLVRRLYWATGTADLAELFSAFGRVEAIALSVPMRTAVVVFETVAGWAAAAAATLSGCCDTVPALYFGPPLVFVDCRYTMVLLHPKKPAARGREGVPIMSSVGALDGGEPVKPTTASRRGRGIYDGGSYTHWTARRTPTTSTSVRPVEAPISTNELRPYPHSWFEK
ncbi:uncharacterized protein LOC121055037 [Oryza brachyantha]|uniref:uncharacterized protein LOC121055037 n=1 Tax=Oryza brachyantha TaxID=4533 RepID=UPI001ADB4003|nr:uncharacterized protein LOC121055037 [Oryza brachyantha]